MRLTVTMVIYTIFSIAVYVADTISKASDAAFQAACCDVVTITAVPVALGVVTLWVARAVSDNAIWTSVPTEITAAEVVEEAGLAEALGIAGCVVDAGHETAFTYWSFSAISAVKAAEEVVAGTLTFAVSGP
jgi:hypothetical protein